MKHGDYDVDVWHKPDDFPPREHESDNTTVEVLLQYNNGDMEVGYYFFVYSSDVEPPEVVQQRLDLYGT